MKFTPTALSGAYVVEIDKLSDERGFFARTFGTREFVGEKLEDKFLESSISWNAKKGTLRGMHLQLAPHGEAKLVSVTKGGIYDVILDLRKESPTFKKWFGVELTADNYKQLLVPKGCAHGFITLEDDTEVHYMISEFFNSGSGSGVRYNDPQFNIQWPISVEVISEKDKAWPDFV